MLEQKYKNEVMPHWIDSKKVDNSMAVPRIEKVVLNVGFGNAKEHNKEQEHVVRELRQITGQEAVVRYAKKSIAGFDLREGTPVGVMVTLRKERMYQFLEKLFNYVMPRVRDFRGLSTESFDGQGNYSLGIADQTIFLEIDPNKTNRRRGIQVTVVTSTTDDEQARELLISMGLPLAQSEEAEQSNTK